MILNVVPQGERFVVERLGKLLEIKESGWFLGRPATFGIQNLIHSDYVVWSPLDLPLRIEPQAPKPTMMGVLMSTFRQPVSSPFICLNVNTDAVLNSTVCLGASICQPFRT
jgi:hypothetical protein